MPFVVCGCLTFKIVETPIDNIDMYHESKHVRIENNNVIIDEYILERKDKIYSIEHFSKGISESGNRYFEIKGDRFILYRNNSVLYTIENILTQEGYIITNNKGSDKTYVGKKYIYFINDDKKIEHVISDEKNDVLLSFYDEILGAVSIENTFFDGLIKTRSGFKIKIDGNEYGLFTFYDPNFYRRKDFPEMSQNEEDRIILYILAVYEISQRSYLD